MNETATKIAQALNETDPKPIEQIQSIVELLGEEKALSFLDQTLEIEAKDGMQTEKGDRRRTPGGVYFYLVRGGMTWGQRRKVFPYFNPQGKQKPLKPYRWEDRERDFRLFGPRQIGVGKVEIKVVGKPLKVIEKSQVTIVTMRSGEPPSLPKGLPPAPSKPTVYLILIANKQWKKVKPFVTEPDNKLIVRGWPIFDKKLGTITVLAQNTTSTLLEKQRQSKKSDSVEDAMQAAVAEAVA